MDPKYREPKERLIAGPIIQTIEKRTQVSLRTKNGYRSKAVHVNPHE